MARCPVGGAPSRGVGVKRDCLRETSQTRIGAHRRSARDLLCSRTGQSSVSVERCPIFPQRAPTLHLRGTGGIQSEGR
eukprot:10265025-Alexandrium_andersonii.AAC.1